jgi:hypothetical protein
MTKDVILAANDCFPPRADWPVPTQPGHALACQPIQKPDIHPRRTLAVPLRWAQVHSFAFPTAGSAINVSLS